MYSLMYRFRLSAAQRSHNDSQRPFNDLGRRSPHPGQLAHPNGASLGTTRPPQHRRHRLTIQITRPFPSVEASTDTVDPHSPQ